jgi:hypothetical protein
MLLNKNLFLIQTLEQQSLVWFKATNTYVLVAHQTADILIKMSEGLSDQALLNWCIKQLNLTALQSTQLLTTMHQMLTQVNTPKPILTIKTNLPPPSQMDAQKYYLVGNKIFKASYESEAHEFLIHPKLAHLLIKEPTHFNHHFEVYQHENEVFLRVDGQAIGQWNAAEVHFFQGKFSMALVERLYQMEEQDWMGVFHATAMSNGEHSILFTGDSGNGKSTLAALLLAKGYTLWADDFVPMSATPPEVYHFPAAISIKEKAVPFLIEQFPQLEQATPFHYPNLGKKVRYLAAPSMANEVAPHLPCKAIVFIKYEANSHHIFNEMNHEEAFQRFIPDSWISPEPENAQQFLQWFANMPCYELTYSDTELMYQTVAQLFTNEV